jgi:nicotinamide phosphoribosyltransferase
MMGPEAAALSGLGHLLHFNGTDTFPAIELVEYAYGAPEGFQIGGSVAATEHSVMCAGGSTCELETIGRLLDLYPSGILSVVSDTWDLWNVLTVTLPKLKDRIMARDGKYVTRPDSGIPERIICGNPDAPEGSPQRKGVVRLLWDTFGGTTNAQGYMVLDPHVGVIYGDGISFERCKRILDELELMGFASSCIVFGMGSYTYQYVTRDVYGMAMKATWADIGGVATPMWKDPVTDTGLKKSARGRLAVIQTDGGLVLVNDATPEQEAQSVHREVWRNGKFTWREDWATITARARAIL